MRRSGLSAAQVEVMRRSGLSAALARVMRRYLAGVYLPVDFGGPGPPSSRPTSICLSGRHRAGFRGSRRSPDLGGSRLDIIQLCQCSSWGNLRAPYEL